MDRKNKQVPHWIWLSLAPLGLACVACVTPWLLIHVPVMAFALHRGFALVCHQQPDRSFSLFGGSVAVCARCLGIYIGTAFGLLLRVQRRVAMHVLMAAVAVNAIDWFTEFAGLHGNRMMMRFMLGIVLGTAAAMVVVASVEATAQARET